MDHRRLGASGLLVSPLALGTMTWGHSVDEHDAKDRIRAFLSAGGNLVDTAYSDGAAETVVGSGALRRSVERRRLAVRPRGLAHETGPGPLDLQ